MIDPLSAKLLGLDIDWFAVDCDGSLGHFTSNGTLIVPPAVREKIEFWKEITHRLLEIPESEGSSNLHQNAETWEPWLRSAEASKRSEYYGVSEEWSNRGFFSFDCPRKLDGNPYFMVTSPRVPRPISDLQPEIKYAIGNLRFGFSFSTCELIPAKTILNL